jgi:WD40 repeat protein
LRKLTVLFLNTGHSDAISTVAFSSDGHLLACGSFDGQLNVWDTATRVLHGTLKCQVLKV